jgi:hypothetical protein
MQDALGRKAIHAALRPATNICSAGLFGFETESAALTLACRALLIAGAETA